jgi:hypothetical protein
VKDRTAPRLATLAAALLFVGFSAAVNRELLPHLADALPGNAGDPMLNAWILGWVSEAVVAQPAELWNAPIFHPHPNALAFSEHLLGIGMFVAPVYWLSGNAVLTYNIAFLAGFALLGFAMFVLVRGATGRTDAGLVAGLVVMCSPYLVSSQVARLQMLSAGWSVLALHWLHRYLGTNTRAALVGFAACWAIQLLSNLYLGVFLAIPVAIVLLVAFARRRPSLTWSRLAALGVVAAVLVAVNAPVLRQYVRAQDELGFAHSIEEVRRYSASPRSYASVWHERESRWLWHEDSSDRALFPGYLLAALAAAGVASLAWRRRAVDHTGFQPLAYVAMAAVVFAITLGPAPALFTAIGLPAPYAVLMDLVPGFDGFRAPGRFAIFVMLALGVLAGMGAAVLLAGRGRAVRVAAVGVVAAASVWDGHRSYDWLALLDEEDASSTAAYEWLAAQPKAAVLELPVVTHFQAQRPYAGGSVTLRYQLAALRHGHTLVNGSSGFVTPLVGLLQGSASPFTTRDTADDALRILRAIGTRYVVVHRHEYLPDVHAHLDDMQAAMRADHGQVESVRDFGSTAVLTLRTAPPAVAHTPAEALARDLFAVSASHNNSVLHQVTDDDLGTRWMAPQHGRTWIEVRLDRTRTVSGVKLRVPHFAVSDYPHHLRVIGTDAVGADHVLFDDAAAYPAAMTAVLEPAAPGLRVEWPARALSRVRLEQPRHSGDRQWAIYELDVLIEPRPRPSD